MILIGKSAVVTGGSRGLGREITTHFLREGADVAICSRTATELDSALAELNSQGFAGKAFGRVSDVSDETSVKSFVADALKCLGKIDILVNNAGIYGPKGNIDVVDPEKWRTTFNINVMGIVYMCQAAVPHMKMNGGGRIINLSGGGATKPMPGISAYAATKTAVVRLTETIAGELAEFNIFVNAIAPGALNTGMLDELLDEGSGKIDKRIYEDALKQRENGGAPLSKGAELCVYLASDKSMGITGKLIAAIWDNWDNLHNIIDTYTPDVYTLRRILPVTE